jgi:hypothetical protein
MKRNALCILVWTFLLPVYAGNERLIGTWKSNKQATLEYLKTHTKLTPAQVEKVGTVLGKTVIVFDEHTLTLKSGDWKLVSKYKIVKEDRSTIILQTENQATKKSEKMPIELDAKGFWTPDEKIPGYKERFERVRE